MSILKRALRDRGRHGSERCPTKSPYRSEGGRPKPGSWGGEMRIKSVVPARPDSYGFAFREAGLARSLTDWRRAGSRHSNWRELVEALRESRLERAIGVIYRPQTEFASHYFEAVMAEQFDAFVWFEGTRAVTPLPAGRPRGAPETYPFGL
jgi:erythromycin esterase-like protein